MVDKGNIRCTFIDLIIVGSFTGFIVFLWIGHPRQNCGVGRILERGTDFLNLGEKHPTRRIGVAGVDFGERRTHVKCREAGIPVVFFVDTDDELLAAY